MAEQAGDANRPAIRLDIGFVTALGVVVAVVAALLLREFVAAASRPLGWAIACAVVAALVRPIVDVLDRRLPRALAVVLSLLGVAVILGGAYAGVAGSVVDNIDTLRDQAPAAAAELESRSEIARDFELESRVTSFVESVDARLGSEAQLRRSPATLSTYVVTGVLTVFLIGYGPRLMAGAARQIRDDDRRKRAVRVSRRALRTWRGYTHVAIGQAVVVTLVAWAVLYAIDLPAPFVLALLIGGFSLIPFAGMLAGGIPALLFAAATADLGNVAVVVALVAGLQLVEILVVRPRVDAATLYVGPALPLIVALIGWKVYALGGALYGVLLLILALAAVDAIAAETDGPPSQA